MNLSPKPHVGDFAKTKDGADYISAVRTWRQVVIQMDDAEAAEFEKLARAKYGEGWKKVWWSALIGRTWYDVEQVEVLRGAGQRHPGEKQGAGSK